MADDETPGSGKRPHLRSVKDEAPKHDRSVTGHDQERSTRGGIRTPLTEAQRETVVALLRADGPKLARNEVARRAGVSGGAVTKIANEIGHTFRREITAEAVTARAIDAQAQRRVLADGLVDDALMIRSMLTRDAPTRDVADLTRAISYLARATVDLDRIALERERASKADLSGAEVDEWLGSMTKGA